MPSKKNAWRRGSEGQVYIPAGVKKSIDDFLWQIKGTRNRPQSPVVGPVKISLSFMVKSHSRRDLDNMVTTALDILQKARVIENDKDIVSIIATKQESLDPRVIISLI